MKPVSRISKFDRVRISRDGPDVILEMPKLRSRAHWTDFQAIVDGLSVAIRQCRQFEGSNRKPDG